MDGTISTEKIAEARKIWGDDVVNATLSILEIFDADSAYISFLDYEQGDHADCVEFLCFETG